MAKLKIGPGGLDLIKSFEELILYVYDDLVPKKKINGKLQNPEWDGSKPKGTLTIGYGHTNAAADPTMPPPEKGDPFAYPPAGVSLRRTLPPQIGASGFLL